MKNSPNSHEQNTLQSLPEEVILVIANYLDPRELINFEQTCHSFNKLTAKDWIWKELLDKHAPMAKNLSRSKYDNAPRELFQELFSDREIAKKVQKETVWGSIKRIFNQTRSNANTILSAIFRAIVPTLKRVLVLSAMFFVICLGLALLTSSLLSLDISLAVIAREILGEAIIGLMKQFLGYPILVGAIAVSGLFLYDTFKSARDHIFHRYDVFCYKSYLTFSINIRRSNVSETHQKYQAANAGIEAAESWCGWGKSMLFLPAWRQNRAFLAGKVAKQQNDNEFIQRCKEKLVA
ncbi:MAG: F-box protein [Proteobacteria bacterium]|nr:F-box protein [Pseudomonadota bacterium]